MARVPNSEAPSTDPAKDTVLAALLSIDGVPHPPPRDHAKRRRGRNKDKSRTQKRERRVLEAARIASIDDEDAH